MEMASRFSQSTTFWLLSQVDNLSRWDDDEDGINHIEFLGYDEFCLAPKLYLLRVNDQERIESSLKED